MIEAVAIILYLVSFGILVAALFFSSEEAMRLGLRIPELPSKSELTEFINRHSVKNNYNIDTLFADFIAGLKLLVIIITGEDLKYIISQIGNYEIIGLLIQGAYILSTLFLAFKIITGRFF